MSGTGRARRLRALVRKETYQVLRDPASILIAFVLPVVLLFLFGYAVSLDVRGVPIGVVVERGSAPAVDLAAAFSASRYFEVSRARDRREITPRIIAGELRGMVVIPAQFAERLASGEDAPVQVITDGASPNNASFIALYAAGVLRTWLAGRAASGEGPGAEPPVALEPRVWFNPELESRATITPGSIAIVMTMIGTLLTALVVAREWERGTMEALFSTPASIVEILAGKLVPYLVLALGATFACALIARHVMGVPLRGSWLALLVLSCAFLFPALGQGLVISALTRNQFVASQVALFSGFLPALLLSGFLFEIDSMPTPIQWLTHVVPARYFVTSLTTLFLAGDVWPLFFAQIGPMLAIGAVFFLVAVLTTRKRLD